MRSRRACFWIGRSCLVALPIVLCSSSRAQGVPGAWTPPDELLTAQNLSKLVADNQTYAIAAGVVSLLVLMAVAYLVPFIRAPRWQILAFALVPLCFAFSTMVALSRPIEPSLQKIPYEEMQKVLDSELATASDKELADKTLKWKVELEGRSFLIGISWKPIGATFAAAAVLVACLWLMSHHRVLRAD
jgi:hypothetical protein